VYWLCILRCTSVDTSSLGDGGHPVHWLILYKEGLLFFLYLFNDFLKTASIIKNGKENNTQNCKGLGREWSLTIPQGNLSILLKGLSEATKNHNQLLRDSNQVPLNVKHDWQSLHWNSRCVLRSVRLWFRMIEFGSLACLRFQGDWALLMSSKLPLSVPSVANCDSWRQIATVRYIQSQSQSYFTIGSFPPISSSWRRAPWDQD
jgi:hypothetical protein